jgi:hypothetical protein
MKPTQNKSKRLAIQALILISGALAWWFFLRGPAAAEGIISLSGRSGR